MKKILLMFAAVAAIAFVGCKTETAQPADETTDSTEVVAEEPTVETVTDQLMNAADEAGAFKILDDLKAKATELLNNKDNEGYFKIMNIVTTVWENCKEQLTQKFPGLAEKINDYITIPEDMKQGFADFVAKAAAEKAGEAVDAAVDAAKDAAGEAVDAAKDAAKDAVDATKDAAGDAAQKAADALKN